MWLFTPLPTATRLMTEFCQVTVPDDRCAGCGQSGSRHVTVLRRFTHLPLGHRPIWLQVATPRYEWQRCGKVWRHRLRSVARARSRLTRTAGKWALAAVVLDHVPVSSVARVLGVAWQGLRYAVGPPKLARYPRRGQGSISREAVSARASTCDGQGRAHPPWRAAPHIASIVGLGHAGHSQGTPHILPTIATVPDCGRN